MSHYRLVSEVLDCAGKVGGFAADPDHPGGDGFHKVGAGEGASGVGCSVVVELAEVLARPPRRVA